jgi:hypothetical protein
MKQPYLYLRGLRLVNHSVFCVENGQKNYWDSQFEQHVAYSSGQQVKRSIIDSVLSVLDKSPSPVTFNSKIEGESIKPKQAFSICDPTYVDQLLGGWMLAKSKADKGKSKKKSNDIEEGDSSDEESSKSKTIKRRSPLSISAMRPLHPLLASTTTENMTLDRSGQAATYNYEDKSDAHKIVVRDSSGNIMSAEHIEKFIKDNDLPPVPPRIWVPDKKGSNRRTSGLFVFDVAVDMRNLFCVSLNSHELEMEQPVIDKLISLKWIKVKNAFGECLLCPEKERNEIIKALANALINWRITSNQSRTFSLMETLALTISDNANKVASAIRAKLSDETEKPKAIPIIDDSVGTDLFIALPCDGYIQGVHGTVNALEDAEKRLTEIMLAFDYENQ